MKKIVLSVLILFLLSSCASTESAPIDIPLDFNGNVSVFYMNTEYSAEMCLYKDGDIKLILRKPEMLAGMIVSVGAEGCTVSYDDIRLSYSAKDFSKTCPFIELYETNVYIRKNQPDNVVKSGSDWLYKFTSESGQCEVHVDETTKTFTKIKTGKYEFIFDAAASQK